MLHSRQPAGGFRADERKFYSSVLKRWLLYVGSVALGLALVGSLLGAFVLALLYPTLPSLETLTDYQPKIPLRVVSAEGDLIGEFGEERRAIVKIAEVPDVMKKAILAAEDERFYSHGGVDYLSVVRAAWSNVTSGTQQGAGTITMQVARNFFLTREKTLTRKLREVLLAWKIEGSLTKDEILELYVNQIFLGQRAYGFAAASQIYFGKPLRDVTVAEAAMLAGLPKAPSSFNPVSNPKRAKTRQQYVLRRMHELGYIDDGALAEAQNAPLDGPPGRARSDADPCRIRRGNGAAGGVRCLRRGRVYAVDLPCGRRCVASTRKRHMPLYVEECSITTVGTATADRRPTQTYRRTPPKREQVLERVFAETPDGDNLLTAVVLEAAATEVKAMLVAPATPISDHWRGLALRRAGAHRQGAAEPADPARCGDPGDPRTRRAATASRSSRRPSRRSSSLDPHDGAVSALIGGFDFDRNKFNHVTQAQRQPGSAFKPFIYSAALEKGFSPATVVNDAPFFVPAERAGGEEWEPKNYDGKFDGPMRIRTALAKSKNLVTVRVLQAIGPQYAQDYIARFGFDPKQHPAYLTMGLGAGSVTPLQMASAYAVFANGGYRVNPYLIAKITDSKGTTLSVAKPSVAGAEAERVDRPAQRLHHDVDAARRRRVRHRDAGPVARPQGHRRARPERRTSTSTRGSPATRRRSSASPGSDTTSRRPLGNNETGGVAALPIWISYMQRVLKNVRGAGRRNAGRRRLVAHQRRFGAARRRRRAVGVVLLRVRAAPRGDVAAPAQGAGPAGAGCSEPAVLAPARKAGRRKSCRMRRALCIGMKSGGRLDGRRRRPRTPTSGVRKRLRPALRCHR